MVFVVKKIVVRCWVISRLSHLFISCVLFEISGFRYFDIDYFDCLIYICFVRNFMNFFNLVFVFDNSGYNAVFV